MPLNVLTVVLWRQEDWIEQLDSDVIEGFYQCKHQECDLWAKPSVNEGGVQFSLRQWETGGLPIVLERKKNNHSLLKHKLFGISITKELNKCLKLMTCWNLLLTFTFILHYSYFLSDSNGQAH